MSDFVAPRVIYVLFELDGRVARVISDPTEVAKVEAGKLGWKGTWNGVRYEQ